MSMSHARLCASSLRERRKCRAGVNIGIRGEKKNRRRRRNARQQIIAPASYLNKIYIANEAWREMYRLGIVSWRIMVCCLRHETSGRARGRLLSSSLKTNDMRGMRAKANMVSARMSPTSAALPYQSEKGGLIHRRRREARSSAASAAAALCWQQQRSRPSSSCCSWAPAPRRIEPGGAG